jgi:hypothetical protein
VLTVIVNLRHHPQCTYNQARPNIAMAGHKLRSHKRRGVDTHDDLGQRDCTCGRFVYMSFPRVTKVYTSLHMMSVRCHSIQLTSYLHLLAEHSSFGTTDKYVSMKSRCLSNFADCLRRMTRVQKSTKGFKGDRIYWNVTMSDNHAPANWPLMTTHSGTTIIL